MTSICLPAGELFIPIIINENDIEEGVRNLLQSLRPTWPRENVNLKLFTDGITNKLVACQLNTASDDKDTVLVRIYGHKTDLLIDRRAELRNIKILNVLGLAPKVYGVFNNGLAYQYYPGDTLNVETAINPKIWPLVSQQMAKMHKVELGKEVLKEPMVWDKTEQFLNLLPEKFSSQFKQTRLAYVLPQSRLMEGEYEALEMATHAKPKMALKDSLWNTHIGALRFVNSFGSVTKLRIEFERLKSNLIKTQSPIVFAHNDLLLGNVIYNKEEEKVSFIDYEYASYNYQAYDIANHFNEFVGLSIEDIDYSKYPSKEFQLSWIKTYLTEYLDAADPSANDIERVYDEVQQLALASHFLWGIWSIVQYELSDIDFDFGTYAEIRLGRYYNLKNKVLK